MSYTIRKSRIFSATLFQKLLTFCIFFLALGVSFTNLPKTKITSWIKTQSEFRHCGHDLTKKFRMFELLNPIKNELWKSQVLWPEAWFAGMREIHAEEFCHFMNSTIANLSSNRNITQDWLQKWCNLNNAIDCFVCKKINWCTTLTRFLLLCDDVTWIKQVSRCFVLCFPVRCRS